jgi:uncharacterized membrane protein
MLFYSGTFQHLNIISGVFQSIHHCVSLLITCEFSTTYLEYQFCCIKKLGSKAIIIMFLAGTLGIIIGGPFALYIVGSFYPEVALSNGEEVWKGLSTIAGSWIGGGANQTAMLEVFGASKSMLPR